MIFSRKEKVKQRKVSEVKELIQTQKRNCQRKKDVKFSHPIMCINWSDLKI